MAYKGEYKVARLKELRGSPFDIFGYSQDRKARRGLIKEYEVLVGQLIQAYEGFDYDVAVEMARLPEIRVGSAMSKRRIWRRCEPEKTSLGYA